MVYVPDGQLLLELPPLQNLAAGSKATLALPVGPTFDDLQLYCRDAGGTEATKAEIIAGITSIRITVNGKEKIFLSGAEAVMLAEFYNSGCVANGTLPLAFARQWMELENETQGGFGNQDGPGWGTAGLTSMGLEVVIAAGGAGAEVVNMAVYARQRAPEELGAHIQILRHTRSFGSAAIDRIIDLPRGVGASGQPLILVAAHINESNISNVELLADRSRLWYAPRSVIHQQYNYPTRRRTPQTGWTHLDFSGLRNRNGDMLTLSMKDLELALTFTVAPADYDILLEVVDVHPSAARPA